MKLLTDRTTIAIDDKCARKRYWYKDFPTPNGRGIVPVEDAEALVDGIGFHDALAKVAEGLSLDDILAEIQPPGEAATLHQRERWARQVGSVVAFANYVWPLIMSEYDVVAIEHEIILDRDPLLIATTPDLVLRHKEKGFLIVDDYKSFGTWDVTKWAAHWPFAMQMHILIKAVEEEFREPVKFARVRGIMKGQKKEGLLRHPYVWAYSNGEAKWQQEWKSGLELRPTWEYPGGPAAWAASLGPEVGLGLFPLSHPIFLNEKLLSQVLAQRLRREAALEGGKRLKLDLDEMYPQSFEECRPAFGSNCPYAAACWNASVEADPIGSGLFVERKPHHELELVMREE